MKKHLLMLFAAVTAAAMSLTAQTIVINEGFENGIQEDVWTQDYVAGHTPWMVEDEADGLNWPATVKQGTKRAYLRNTTGETQGYVTRLVSKVMDLSPRKVYQPELSFWYANPRWSADRDTLRVLYRTSPNGKWKQLAEYSTAMANWQKVKMELPEVGATYQIAFEGTDNLGRGIVLDSILLRSAPECTVPHDIFVSNKGSNRVNIAWSASWDAINFELIVCQDTIDPYDISEETEANLTFHGMVDGFQQSFDLTLEAGEHYLVYVRSICENEISLWSSEESENGPYGFRVRATKQVPFSETFNYPSTQNRDQEWSWGNNTGKTNPYVNSKSTSASELGKYSNDKTPAVIFSGGANATTVIPAGSYVYLATPALADTLNENFHINQCQVHFWSTVYTSVGRQYGRSLIVGVMEDPDDITTFMPVDTVSVWENKGFVENIVDLGRYSGNGAYVAFKSDFDRQNLFYIDNVSVEYRPEVNKVTRVSVNPRDTYALITWEGTASSYNVLVTNAEVDPSNPDADAVVAQATVNTNSYRCDDLEADHSWNHPYYVYVQADDTEWSYRYPFVTIASQREVPYVFDFETASGRYKIGSSYYATGLGIFGNDSKYPALTTTNKYKGEQCLFMNKVAGTDAWVTLPMVDRLDTVQIKFYLSGGATGTGYKKSRAAVGVMTNPMDINTFVKVADFTLNTTGYTMCYANFRNYEGPEGVIAIVWDDIRAMADNTVNYIDEIRVEELSECVPPSNVRMEVESDSITLYWDKSVNFMWETLITRTALTTAEKDKSFAELAAMGKTAFADTLMWDDVSLSPDFGIGGLQSQTDYYLYIRTVCGGDVAWWTELTFTTPCPSEPFPFKETFDDYSSISQLGCWQIMDYNGTGYPMLYSANGGKTLELWSTSTSHHNVVILPAVEGELSDMMLCFETRSWSTSSASVLYVGTMEDINNESSFVPFDTIRNVAGAGFQKVCLVLDDYTLAYNNIAISSGLGTVATASDVLIDNIELKDASCIEPYDFRQTAEDDHSVDFIWNGLSLNDMWELRILNSNVSLANITSGNYDSVNMTVVGDTVFSGKAFHVEDLEPITTYYVYIRALCGDSTWTVNTIQTACEKLNPNKPNKETFETYAGGTSYSENYQAPCWYGDNGYANASSSYLPYIYNSSSYSNSGTKTYRMYGYEYSGYVPAYVVSPEIDCASMTELAVTFYMYASTSYSWLCGVMTDPHDLSTFVVLDSVKGTGESQQYTYDLSEYADTIPATARYFAWRTPYDATSYAYLDDVSIMKMNCPFTKPSYSDLTAQTVRIGSGLRTDDEWLLLVTNAAVSTDSLLSETYHVPESLVVFYDTIDVRSKRVNGLSEQTNYYVYTATLCDSVVSQWSSLSFITPCLALKPDAMGTITFSEAEGYITGSGANRYLPCWTVNSKTQGLSPSSSYIPYITTSYQHNGHNSLYFYDYVYGTSSNYVGAYAVMPELYVDSIRKYQVNFWGRGYSSSSYNSQIIVGIVSDPSNLNTFVAIDTLNLSHSEWEPYSVGFENYEGDYLGNLGRNIMFLSEFGVTNYAYITEISVSLIPSCRPVSSFSVDSIGEDAAVVSWKGYQDSFRLLVADRVLEDVEKPTYSYLIDSIVYQCDRVRITGLQPTTNYYVYAQGICGDGDSTDISLQYGSVRTLCPVSTGVPVPFYEDFMSYETGETDPGCWIFRGSSYTKIYSVTSGSGSKSYHAIDLYTTSGTNNGYIVVPALEGSLADMKVEFECRTYSSSSTATATLYVGTMDDPEDPTTFVPIDTFTITGSEFVHYEMLLADYTLAHERLVFTSGIGTSASSDLYITNIRITMESPCHAPKLKVLGTSFNTVDVEIVPAKPENDLWEVVVIADSIYSTIRNLTKYLDTTSTKMVLDTTYFSLKQLAPATSYYLFARTNCGGVYGMSNWMKEPLKVHTQFYYKDSYFFGFEKSELWERSTYAKSDAYYIHPALVADRSAEAEVSTSYTYYPYSQENTSYYLYAHTGTGALTLYSSGNYYGGYVIFPAVDEAHNRSFEFKVRPAYISVTGLQPVASYDAVVEIGTVDKNRSFDTYRKLATVRIDKLPTTAKASEANHQLFSYYTLDIDSATVADKQIVIYSPKQPSVTSSLYFDDVTLTAAKGYSLVSIERIVPAGTTALVEWQPVGGPWNLYIYDSNEQLVTSYMNLQSTSQVVSGLAPQTAYKAVLASAAAPANTDYVVSSSQEFRTVCQALDPDATGAFSWNFDDPADWEANDVLAGTTADTLYLKPSCFKVGITYNTPANGYQWLIQRKGFDYYTTAISGSSYANYEVGRDNTSAMRVHTASSYYASYLVLPELNCNLDTMMIEFYGRCFVNYDENYATSSGKGKIVSAGYLGANYSQSIVVGTLTDPNDFSTLRVIDTLTYKHTELTDNDNVNNDPDGLRYWELMQLPLTGAQGRHIVLFQPAPGLFIMDDLSVKGIGNTLFAPYAPHTVSVTANTATLAWSVRHPALASVVVVLDAATGEEVIRATVNGTQYTAQNLSAGSSYRWYVYQTDNTRSTPQTNPVTFNTECITITPAYTCSFEDEEGWMFIDGQNTEKQTLCWTYSDAMQDGWVSASYDPHNQANTEYYLYSKTGDNALNMRASYASYGTSYLPYVALPAMDITAYDTLQLEFWMRPAYVREGTGVVASAYTGSSYAKSVIVGTMTDPENAATFMPIDTVTYDGTLSTSDVATEANDFLFQHMKVELTGATGPYVAIMTTFYAKGSTTRQSSDYVWIDDISFARRKMCKEPVNLNVNRLGAQDAVLGWQGAGEAFLLQVSTDNYFADDEAFVFNDTVYANVYTVSGLLPMTSYVWRVQALCGDEESGFSAKGAFKTLRSPYFHEDFATAVSQSEWIFSSSKAENILDMSTAVSSGDNSYGFKRANNNYGLETPHYTSVGYLSDYNWMITPAFYLPENDSVHFSMDLALTACNTNHAATSTPVTESDMQNDYYFMIIVSEDGGDTWKSENILAKWQNTNPAGQQLREIAATGQNVRFSLAKYAGKNVRIGLYREAKTSTNTGIAIHVDNIRLAYYHKIVDYASGCQYEDIDVGNIHLSGDDTEPGIHYYPKSIYATDEQALSGQLDTVYSLEIEVFAAAEYAFSDTICEGDAYTDENFHGKETTGVYRRKLQSVHGCDSIISLDLTVIPRTYGEDLEVAICPGETFTWNGTVYTRAGIFRDTLENAAGCDSVMTLVISYRGSEDTIRVASTVTVDDLPFTYEDPAHPYVDGQQPVFYPEGTAPGVYKDTVLVQGESCAAVLIHTLTIEAHEGFGLIDASGTARKLIYHDRMYIFCNDEWYNANGQRVRDPRE